MALEIVSKIFGYSLDFGYDFSTPPARNGRVSKINTFWIFLDMRIQKIMKHVAIYSKSALGAYPNVSKRIQSYPNVSKRIQNQNVRVSKNRIRKKQGVSKNRIQKYISIICGLTRCKTCPNRIQKYQTRIQNCRSVSKRIQNLCVSKKMSPNVSKSGQTYPNVSKNIQTYPNVSKIKNATKRAYPKITTPCFPQEKCMCVSKIITYFWICVSKI